MNLVIASKLKREIGSVSLKRKGMCCRKKKTIPRDVYLLRQSKNHSSNMSISLNTDLKEKRIQISSSTVRWPGP